MRSIFKELKRRRVYRVALAYGIFASAMIQIGGTILPIFRAPQWTQQLFIVLVAAGFPLSLVLGWLYDITAEGIRRTPNAKGLRVYSKRQLWLVGVAGTLIALSHLRVTGSGIRGKTRPKQPRIYTATLFRQKASRYCRLKT
jgi:hypothetical protein